MIRLLARHLQTVEQIFNGRITVWSMVTTKAYFIWKTLPLLYLPTYLRSVLINIHATGKHKGFKSQPNPIYTVLSRNSDSPLWKLSNGMRFFPLLGRPFPLSTVTMRICITV